MTLNRDDMLLTEDESYFATKVCEDGEDGGCGGAYCLDYLAAQRDKTLRKVVEWLEDIEERGVDDPEGLLFVTLHNVPIAFGDLNGDGAADAAVIIATNSSGSGTFVALVAVLNDGGSPAQPLPPT